MNFCILVFILSLLVPALALETGDPKEGEYLVIVKKQARSLEVFRVDGNDRRLVKNYRIALGSQPIGHKQRQGDGATPEGSYYITHKNAASKFHLSLGISYPNLADAESGVSRGLISKQKRDEIASALRRGGKPPQGTALGGDIFIHGGGTGSDWTAGCVALDNKDIEELFALLPLRTPVKIEP